jgi:hypothetical protein
MELPMEVEVFCDAEVCGRSAQLVIDPITEEVTHVIVAEGAGPPLERLVPIKYIVKTTHRWIKLSCTPAEFAALESFRETDFIDSSLVTMALPFEGAYVLWPYSLYAAMPEPLEGKHLPAGKVAIHRGTSVEAVDGCVGQVDEFLVYPTTHGISHLILREGHLWGKKDVIIPVDVISKITDEAVYLTMDKETIEALPAIPLSRKWK